MRKEKALLDAFIALHCIEYILKYHRKYGTLNEYVRASS